MRTNLVRSLKINSIISYSVLAGLVFTILAFRHTVLTVQKESQAVVYVMATDGDILPLLITERKDIIEIEAKHHITMLIESFYNINQSNFGDEVEKALWLGDLKSFHELRITRKIYNNILTFNLNYKTTILDIQVTKEQKGKMSFKALFDRHLTGEEGVVPETDRFEIKGVITIGDRNFPHNPHGMYIDQLTEIKSKLNEE